jgi:hypothetical protein
MNKGNKDKLWYNFFLWQCFFFANLNVMLEHIVRYSNLVAAYSGEEVVHTFDVDDFLLHVYG